MSTESTGGSRLPRSNSVKSATAENSEEEESRPYDERVAERAAERVKKFREEYPHLAKQPLSLEPGQQLREAVAEEEYRTEYVEGDREWESGHTTEHLDRLGPVTWDEALFTFLCERQPYDDGMGGKFRDTEADETFTVDFHDCWTSEYGEKQAAKNKGAERQLMGGMYPDNAESERAGELEEPEWSGDVATAVMALTGSSTPDGERLPPVDHAEAVTSTWTNSGGSGSVYDVVRNVLEKELGLESDEWGFVRGDDVHGMGPHDEPGENACHVHEHPTVYFDVGATDLREQFDTDFEVKAVIETKLYKAVEKHVELCEIAEPEAHTKEESIEVRLDLDNPAGYATEYLRLDDDEPMMERPVEFQAFATVEWARNRQRIARSKLFTDAAKADFCKQDSDSYHAERLRYDRSGHGDPELVCAECGSGVGIDAETMAEYRLSEDAEQDVEDDLDDVVVGASVGESTDAARVRSEVESHVEKWGEPESVTALMGELSIAPQHRPVVEEVLAGEDTSGEVEPVMGPPRPAEAQHQLEAIVMPDGGEEEVSGGGGGGVNMVALKLPKERLLRETRLAYVGEVANPKIPVGDGGRPEYWTYNPRTVAGWLVNNGYRKPWHAELALEEMFSRCDGLPEEFDEPLARPPPGVSGEQS